MNNKELMNNVSGNLNRDLPCKKHRDEENSISMEILTGSSFGYDTATAKKLMQDIEGGRECDLIFIDEDEGRIDLYLAVKNKVGTKNGSDLYRLEYASKNGYRVILENTSYFPKFMDCDGYAYDEKGVLIDE